MRKRMCFHAVIVTVALVAIALGPGAGNVDAAGNTGYVSPGGDNLNPGTLELPWADPGYASRQMESGDTLVILGGTYQLNQYDADIISPPSGAPGSWTTVRGEEGNRPVLAGGGNLIFAIDLSGRSYVSVENLEITSDGGAPFREAVNATGGPLNRCLLEDLYVHHIDEFGVDIADTRYLEINDCVIEYCGFGSVGGPDGVQGGWRDVVISGCDLSYNGHYYQGGPGPSPYARPDGFGIETSSGPIEIVSTTAEHNRGDGLDSKASNTNIHECVVANNSCDGVKLWGGGSRLENTLIYGTGDGVGGGSPWAGLVISDGDNPGARFEVVNVTIHDNPEREAYPMYVQYDYDVPIQVLMRNCIVANGYGLAFFGDSVTVTADHNTFYRPGGQAQVYANGREYGVADIDSGVLGEGNVCADPMFASPAWGSEGDYHLGEGSPAIDSGTGDGAPGADLEGGARPTGDGYDMGAYEFGAAAAEDEEGDEEEDENDGDREDADETLETWYLAEGTTDWGFDCYITIQNPGSEQAGARVTYMTNDGPQEKPEIALPAASQTTINPRDDLGNIDFSTKVECITEGKTIAVDRTMTWTGTGAPSPDGHCSVGVAFPNETWYLAEGSSAWGFECWLLIQNPEDTEATCQVTYMIEGADPVTVEKKVPANSRQSYNMADDIGAKDASIKVEADIPVIPERAMYRNNRRSGHDSIGTTEPAASYYLAEGTTDWGFTTYVLVQNPQDTATDVTVTYMTSSGPVPQAPFNMPANSRKTIRVNDVLPDTDFSTHVHGSQNIIAERAMYWDNGTGEACHDSIGLPAPHNTFYLPDGQTSEGRETYTLVQNPNDTEVTVEVSYLTADDAGNVTFTETVGANSRKTFSMADKGISGRASVMVTCKTAGKKIMCERAMYWNTRGAGTDTIGGYYD